MTNTLNQGQQEASDDFFKFLLSGEKEMIISGPGGVGKSFLMCHLIDKIIPSYHSTCRMLGVDPKYDRVEMTATTNKAAEVLATGTNRPTSTIHSLLNLTVQEDYQTGQTKLKRTDRWRVHENMILFVDECSMIDTPLEQKIHEGTHNCKIVYVGDHCQLAPVTEPISPIYTRNIPFCELTEPMRTTNPYLQALNEQMRHSVETGEFFPIQEVPGIIDWFDDEQMQTELDVAFAQQTHSSRILAYTNSRVNQFNDHIRELRQLPAMLGPGEFLINNSAVQLRQIVNGKSQLKTLSVEAEVEILDQSPITRLRITEDVDLDVTYCTLKTGYNGIFERVPVPVDRDHFHALIKYFGRVKNWQAYFHLKQSYPDLRPRDAGTVYKAQGSTYDTVYVDLGNISTCHNPNQAARMLYVALSRCRHRIVLYGHLAEKYGGVLRA